MAVELEIKCYLDKYSIIDSTHTRYDVRVVVTATGGSTSQSGFVAVTVSWCGGKYTNLHKRLDNVVISPNTRTQVFNEVVPFSTGSTLEATSINNGRVSLISVYANYDDSVDATLSRTLNNIIATPTLSCYENFSNDVSKVDLGEQVSFNLWITATGTKDPSIMYDVIYTLGNVSQNVRTNTSTAYWYWAPSLDEFASAYGPSTSYLKPKIVLVAKDANQDEIYRKSADKVIDTYLPASIRPTITSVTPSDKEGHQDFFGVYIGTKSILQASVEASGIYGSTITKVEYQIDNLSVSTTDSDSTEVIGRLDQSGSRTLKTTVTDSRGRTAVRNTTITVVPYVLPSVTATANRWDSSSGDYDDVGEYVKVEYTANIPSYNGYNNQAYIYIDQKESGAENYDTTTVGHFDGPSLSQFYIFSSQSINKRYEYRVRVSLDRFSSGGTAEATTSVGIGTPIIEFHNSGKGIGIGTVAPETGLNIGMQAEFRGTDDDGFSRIRISNPEGTESIALAKLTGSDLVLLAPSSVTDYDRAFVNSHIFMQNNRAIGGVTTAGVQRTMLRLNSSNQVELNWTSGGLKGRVFKQIWSGTWSGGSITVSEAPYYNLFGFNFGNPSGQTWTGLGFRNGSVIHAFTFSWNSSGVPICSVAVKITVSGTTMSLTGKSQVGLWLNEWDKNALQSNAGITKIWGIL